MSRFTIALLAMTVAAVPTLAQRTPSPAPRANRVANLRYEVTFDSATAATRTIRVATTFDVAGAGPVLLSLPAWTPGSYEISNFVREVRGFAATAGGQELDWDKVDWDTWRVQAGGAGAVTVSFDVSATTLDNAAAWSAPDFAFFNGTNLFLYPEGRADFAATVTVRTEPSWLVATGMRPAGAARTYRESNYHDLVDTPFFVGRLEYDSARVAGKWMRLATYPAGVLSGEQRAAWWRDMEKLVPPQVAVFGEAPWDSYTHLIMFTPESGGGSALEHSNSELAIYNPGFVGDVALTSVTSHEIFHAWNVKRLRPAAMVPYRYDAPQPTPLLWVSEGITDYYADVALVRGGVVDSLQFLGLLTEKLTDVAEAPPTALEDASLSTWVGPTDGSGTLYYPKGAVVGLLIDILIRDASDNARSLDNVMRELYRSTFKAGRGFTDAEWWRAVTAAAGGRSFAEFAQRYVDGRDPLPYDSVLPLAGLRFSEDTLRVPVFGLGANVDSSGVQVTEVTAGGMAESAGVRVGDYVITIGGISIQEPGFIDRFQAAHRTDGGAVEFGVRRDGREVKLNGRLVTTSQTVQRVMIDPGAAPKAQRIRAGLFRGETRR